MANKVIKEVGNGNSTVQLKNTQGKPLQVSITSHKNRKDTAVPQVSFNQLNKLRSQGKFSDNVMDKIVTPFIRKSFGRKSVQPNYRAHMIDETAKMKEFLEVKLLDYKVGKDSKGRDKIISCETVLCPNLNDLVDFVKHRRNIKDDDCHIRIGMDSGGDFLKVTMNVIDKSKHKDGNGSSSGDSDTCVFKMFIIGLVKKISENHHNMKQILEDIDIDSLQCEHTYCGDQKMANILVGIKNHASNYPCGYCTAECTFSENQKAPLRTLEMLANDLKEKRGNKVKYCVVNSCLLSGKPENTVLELFPPPALHLRLRIVNHLCEKLAAKWMMARPDITSDPVIQFNKDRHIVRMSYHGGGYEGNQCNKILQKAELLAEKVPENLTIYTDCLIAFREVQKSCFGWTVEQGYAAKIQDFREKYKDLLINVTPSVHSSFEHILDWFQLKGAEFGLALYSEQATESAHGNFLSTVWEKGYKVPDTHPQYADNMVNAVAKYNSRAN